MLKLVVDKLRMTSDRLEVFCGSEKKTSLGFSKETGLRFGSVSVWEERD